MAALKEIARDVASEILDGIGWVIVYRTGRSWHSVTLYSDLGNMTAEDYDTMQAAREAHAALAEVVASHYPDATGEAVERIAEAASSVKISPETMQRILDAFDEIWEAVKALGEWAAQAIRTLADFFTESLDNFLLRRAPPKWRHYALHAKRARVRKKYRDRIRRAFFASMASEGGGSS